jgi:hypothetical protein
LARLLDARRETLISSLSTTTSIGIAIPYVGRPGALRAKWGVLKTEQRRRIIAAVLDLQEVAIVVGPATKQGVRSNPDRVKIVSKSSCNPRQGR